VFVAASPFISEQVVLLGGKVSALMSLMDRMSVAAVPKLIKLFCDGQLMLWDVFVNLHYHLYKNPLRRAMLHSA
jgi:hypothetical protein